MDTDYRKELVEYYKQLNAHKLTTEQEYQKVILLISGGTLSISLTCNQNLVSSAYIFINIILVVGWLTLLATVSLQLLYYRKVASNSEHLIDSVEQVLAEKTSMEEIYSLYNTKMKEIRYLSKISVYTMVIGLFLISLCISMNIFLR